MGAVMAKVVLGTKQQDAPVQMPYDRAKEAPKLEVVQPDPARNLGESPKPAEATPPPVPPPSDDASQDAHEGLEPGDDELPEIVRRKIGKKHRQMKEAQEAASDAESFARQQFLRAQIAEEEAAKLRTQISQAQPAPAQKPELKAPDKADAKYLANGQFNTEQWIDDVAAYKAEIRVQQYEAERQLKDQQAQQAAFEAAAAAKLTKAKAAHKDWDAVVAGSELQVHNSVLGYLPLSDYMGEITYYLASHPEYVERINKLTPMQAVAEIGKLELSFEKPVPAPTPPPEPPKASGAPPPITPLNIQKPVDINTDPAKMDFRQLREYERARKLAKRR